MGSENEIPLTYNQIQTILEAHREHVADQLSDHSERIDARVGIMAQHIVQGFEKVGDKITDEMKEFRRTLIPSATNERKLDIKVVMPIIYTLCGVITGLVVWFTGVKPFIPTPSAIIQYEKPNTTATHPSP